MDKIITKSQIQIGLLSAFLAFPQAIVFSTLAGLPIGYGILASMLGTLLYLLLGGEYYIIVGPVSIISLELFSGLTKYFIPKTQDYIMAAMIVTFFIAIFQILISKTKLLKMVEWIHPTAVKGITAGIGVSIILSQIPIILNTQEPFFIPTWEQAKYSLWNHWSWMNIFIFLFTFLIYNSLKLIKNTWIKKLKILIAIVASSFILSSFGVIAPQIGNVSFTNVSLNLKVSDNVIFELPYLIHIALGLAIIAIIQSLLVSEYFAKKEKINIKHDREIYIQGLTNLVVSLIAFFPVSTSINRSVAHYEAGARDKYSGILSVFFILIMFLIFKHVINMIYLSSLSVMLFIVSTSLIKNLFQEEDKDVAHYVLFFCCSTIFINITVSIILGIILGAYHHISNIKKLSMQLKTSI